MTTQPNFGRQKSFVTDLLPWLIAAGALLVYLVTLNHWITLGSLNYISQVAGWSWPQNMLPPLYFVATFPLRWLPAAWLPGGLNLFSAVCAAFTLAQLARSVALLPHDRTQAQREREHSEYSLLTIRTAWLPMVFAVLVCGLQLTFWENAVAASGEMLDILLFAYIVRCLLEYRIDGRESQLMRAALIYGAAMSNNWLMGGFLPVFVAALLWVKKLSFFNIRFLLRIAGLGLAGMLFYLLMPLVQSHGAGTPASYWDILHYSLAMQKNILLHLPVKSLWILGLTSLLPLVVLSIRWAASFGDSSPLGVALASFMFHLVHGMFLFACLWVAFDPPFSPRIFPRQYHYGASWLPLYYLGALCLGYYSGYFLLIFGKKGVNPESRNSLLKLINVAVLVAVWVIVVVAAVGLIYKNLPQIQALNRDTLRTYASLLVKNLPPKSALVLADNPQVLLLAEAALPHTAGSPAHVFLNTATLPFPAYHRFLESKYPANWKNDYSTNQPMRGLPPGELVRLLTRAADSRDIYYLHPSFGYYFEQFYPEAHGLAYKLNIYPTNAIVPPSPSAENMAENLAFWQREHTAFFSALDQPAPSKGKKTKPGFGESALQYFQLRREPDLHQLLTGIMCARALDWWGVMLQQNQKLTDAAWCFQRAHEINPDNVAAEINLVNNQTILQTGSRTPLQITEAMEAQLRKFQNWDQTLNANGPLDEAQYCFEQGRVFAEGRLYRQAAQYLLRAKELAPDKVGSYLWLAQIYNLWHQSDKALELVRAARKLPADPAVQDGLISAEAAAYFNKNKPEIAERLLETALAADPKDENLLNAALRLYISYQRFTNALDIVERQLQSSPDSPTALNNQGFIYLQLRQYKPALTPLDHLLRLDPSNPVGLLNRAIARLQSDQLDGSKQDYEALQILSPKAFQVYYGLGEIAYRQKDTKNALANYHIYLSNAPPTTAEWKLVNTRVQELKATPP